MNTVQMKIEATSRGVQEGGRQVSEWTSPEAPSSLTETNIMEVEVEVGQTEGATEVVELSTHLVGAETLRSGIAISRIESYPIRPSENSDLQLTLDDTEIFPDVPLLSGMPPIFEQEWISENAAFLSSLASLEYDGKLLFESPLVRDRTHSSTFLKSVAMSTMLHSFETNRSYKQFLQQALAVSPDLVIGPSVHEDIQGFRLGSELENLKTYRMLKGPISIPFSSSQHSAQESDDITYRASRHFKQATPTVDHFQLRNLLVSPSQHDAFYANKWKVCHIDPSDPPGTSNPPRAIFDLEETQQTDKSGTRITTLDMGCENILMAGCFNGSYAYLDLLGNSEPVTGKLLSNEMINHISISPVSMHPTANLACNDPSATLITLDLARNEILTATSLPIDNSTTTTTTNPSMNSPIVNCTALSPCGRLRLLVGDFPNTLLTDARCAAATLLHSLPTPPLSFAAAWAPDNAWYVATASDFGDFRLWDARMWRVFASFRATMAPVRALRFAPLGPGGSLALFAAESFDRVHVVDVLAARCVQTMQFLGEVGGLAVGSDGSEVMVANGDCTFGGITVFERNVDMNSWNSPRIVNEWDGSGYGRRNRGLNWRGVDGLMDLDLL